MTSPLEKVYYIFENLSKNTARILAALLPDIFVMDFTYNYGFIATKSLSLTSKT